MSENDFLARTGGDEFLVLCNHVASKEDLRPFAEKLISIVKHPFNLNGEIAHVSMSVGIAVYPENGKTDSDLVKNADIAMYSAKTSGKNAYRYFEQAMESEVNRKNMIEDALAHAIENEAIYMMYQPQFDMKTGHIFGCEALMRLKDPHLGEIPPSEFIPVAEDNGFINALGEWALRTACAYNQQLIFKGIGPLTVSVNISVEQLKGPDFPHLVSEILSDTGMHAKYLELDVTESILTKNYEHNIQVIQKLREMGIRIALDDFGTGYSSFNYLTRMPIDTLKMDKSFVDHIGIDSKDNYVAQAIIELAHKLQISVTAEGIETREQLKILKDNFCDMIQGYIFSRPLLPDDYRELVVGVNK